MHKIQLSKPKPLDFAHSFTRTRVFDKSSCDSAVRSNSPESSCLTLLELEDTETTGAVAATLEREIGSEDVVVFVVVVQQLEEGTETVAGRFGMDTWPE